MAQKPTVMSLEASGKDILNAIRNEASPQYREAVPVATGTIQNLREIGDVILHFDPKNNEFIHALVNRIGRVVVQSKMYSNPWAMFKKGMMELGETVESIFVRLAEPHQYNPEEAETTLYKRTIPDVLSAFHTMNYQKFYPDTISNDQLRTAFLSWQGIEDLIARIIDSMYAGANWDEFLVMKYLLAKMILKGNVATENIPTATADNAKAIVSTVKGVSNQLTFMSNRYNLAHVENYTNKDDQIVILNSKFDAVMDVEVLAAAFNLPYAQFMGQRVLVDSFAEFDDDRMGKIFANDPNTTYTPFTAEEKAFLESIPMVILDRDWFMVFDNFQEFNETYNPKGLYWNYFLHEWKTVSASPFANAIAFTSTALTITGVTVTPTTASLNKGSALTLSATVAGTGYVPQGVVWEIVGNVTDSSITEQGTLFVGLNETATTFQVKATSKSDGTKSALATITVTA